MRRLATFGAVAVLAATGACSFEPLEELIDSSPTFTGCHAIADDDVVELSAEQTSNAATIAAVGEAMGMGEHALVVALATAWQESSMVNIDFGDRDSVGLFQQRPSQGWGTVEELMDPAYASFKFYEKLNRIDDWQDMRVTEAAQAVQVSEYPELYDQWEGKSTVMAAALRGSEEATLGCHGNNGDERVSDYEQLAEAFAHDFDRAPEANVDGQSVTLPVDDPQSGQLWAHWMIAKTDQFDLEAVEFNGQIWQPGSVEWDSDSQTSTDEVVVILAGTPEIEDNDDLSALSFTAKNLVAPNGSHQILLYWALIIVGT